MGLYGADEILLGRMGVDVCLFGCRLFVFDGREFVVRERLEVGTGWLVVTRRNHPWIG
jgi:hypothetical protein